MKDLTCNCTLEPSVIVTGDFIVHIIFSVVCVCTRDPRASNQSPIQRMRARSLCFHISMGTRGGHSRTRTVKKNMSMFDIFITGYPEIILFKVHSCVHVASSLKNVISKCLSWQSNHVTHHSNGKIDILLLNTNWLICKLSNYFD